jgi:tetratricopeptide (TPR) repeat protein
MTYEGADSAFADALTADPDCALAYWGRAMSHIHPLWSDPPDSTTFALSAALVEKARSSPGRSPLESAWIDAAAGYFDGGRSGDEHPNLAAFDRGWREVVRRFPDDVESRAFHALAMLGTVDPADKSLATQREAANVAQGVLAEVPDHPGALHYAIHAFDYPPLAEHGLELARSYGRVAPDVPHALHMPTHVATRLGLWKESIELNVRSAGAALHHPVQGAVSLHYMHALDYLAYAHLQLRDDDAAEGVARDLAALESPVQIGLATAYAFAAVPARLALELQRWPEAAALQPRVPGLPWERFPAMEAITWFARGLGAAHVGDGPGADAAIAMLATLRDRAEASSGAYWATQVEIQRLVVRAWRDFVRGERRAGVDTMRAAARLEATTEKHAVTPGEVLPAAELLGDMLLADGRPAEALTEYRRSLERSPDRFNSLWGAARSAELAGDSGLAMELFSEVVAMTAGADGSIERVRYARRFVDEHAPTGPPRTTGLAAGARGEPSRARMSRGGTEAGASVERPEWIDRWGAASGASPLMLDM